ncbi:unnamed protein product [Meganyctiphanes norvegica]|uniref:Uncharacterized protein n=1 Tax=Meganyctiphanes norvegica TaxID=48144 RepID=A0AAV2RRI9_MEGNR
MAVKSLLLQAVVLALVASITIAATIGDGNVSLYTGRPIDRNSNRGACLVDGREYPSDTAIPRAHPCHYCICYQGQVTCYWKQCSVAPHNCAVLHFEHTCNPSLYMCSIPEKTKKEPVREFGARLNTLRRRRLIREVPSTSSMRLPVDEPFPVKFDSEFVGRLESHLRTRRAVNGSSHHNHGVKFHQTPDKSCTILGVKYNLGEVIGVATDVCMECRCAAGNMYCSPKCCFQHSPFKLEQEDHDFFSKSRKDIDDDPPKPHPLHQVRNQYLNQVII